MPEINAVLFVVGVLLLIGVASSRFAARVGMPVLVLFLGVGMLAGSEGLGGIAFENYGLAVGLGTAALCVILFDGGLRTPLTAVRSAWKPALVLSTGGVLVTSVLTGLAAAWLLDLPLLYGILLGCIVGSTDAAAVFSVLRASKLTMPERLEATLEIESGSNDPMAVFLTLGLIQVLLGEAEGLSALLGVFVTQFGVGAVVGLGVGWGSARLINAVRLDAAGLYPILASACGLLAFGAAAVLGGSGFLAVYLAGIVLGNSVIVFKRGILAFHDAVAWFGQIALFVMLGLLSFPSRLLAVAGEGLLIALVLILVARPLAVGLTMLPFRFRLPELTFLAWVGLKGAVPITLATFPLLAGLPGSEVLFNVVFFVVLISAVTQGWSLPLVARWLGLARPAPPDPPVTLEISTLLNVDGAIVDYLVDARSPVAGRPLHAIALPEEAVVAMIVRGEAVVVPRGGTVLEVGDHVFVGQRRAAMAQVERLFEPVPLPEVEATAEARAETARENSKGPNPEMDVS